MILTMKQVVAYTSLSRATINKYVLLGLFPAPIKLLGGSRIGFLKSEIDVWITEMVQARDKAVAGA